MYNLRLNTLLSVDPIRETRCFLITFNVFYLICLCVCVVCVCVWRKELPGSSKKIAFGEWFLGGGGVGGKGRWCGTCKGEIEAHTLRFSVLSSKFGQTWPQRENM